MINVKFSEEQCDLTERLLKSLIEGERNSDGTIEWDSVLVTCFHAVESIERARISKRRYFYKIDREMRCRV